MSGWTGSPVTYALGSAGLVVVVEAGDRPDGSAVYAADEVRLRQPFPDEVVATLSIRPGARLPVYGFVRMPEGCLPLGELTVMSHGSSRTPGASQWGFEECRLHIDQRLPFSVLDRVRPMPVVELPDLAWLDLLPGDPIGALRRFVTGWFADVPAVAEAPPTASVQATPVPPALAALYEAAAGRRQPLGGFNRIFTPDRFKPRGDGRVVFGTECQGVWNLLMDPDEPDPAVTYDDLGNGPVVERERLAGFLVQFVVADAAIGTRYGGIATTHPQAARGLVDTLSPVPLQPLHWPADPTRLYVGPGLAVAVCPAPGASTTEDGPDLVEIYAGSRHRIALRPAREPGFQWDHFTG